MPLEARKAAAAESGRRRPGARGALAATSALGRSRIIDGAACHGFLLIVYVFSTVERLEQITVQLEAMLMRLCMRAVI
jgi:hypothetical protein